MKQTFILSSLHSQIRRRHIIVRYLVAGGIGVLTNLIFLYILTEWLRLWYFFSSIIAVSISITVGFMLQKFVTFENFALDVWRRQAVLYAGLALINIAVNSIFLYALVEIAGLYYLLAQIVASGSIAVGSFIVYHYLIFPKRRL